MILRRFNDAGLAEFRVFLRNLRSDLTIDLPEGLLTDLKFSEAIVPEVDARIRAFASRFEFAEWLSEEFERAGAEAPMADVGFWVWLTAALFDQLCPRNGSGRRKVGADARYIPNMKQWTRRYRHLLANPFHVYQVHRDDPRRAAVALVNPLHSPGELTEQFTGRLDLMTCPGTMAVATALFIDPGTGLRRSGASGNAARRLGKLMNQYTRTWDLASVETSSFTSMLPREFNRFRS